MKPGSAALAGLTLLALAATGCPRATGRAPAAADDAPSDLAALADELDPGEVPPLLEGMPSALSAVMGTLGGGGGGGDLAELKRRLDEITDAGTTSTDGVQRLVGLLFSLSLDAERRADACDVECLGLLERAYGILDIPMFASAEGMFGQLVDAVARIASPEHGAEITAYLRRVFTLAHGRHRYVAVRLLRRAPRSAQALTALRTLANHADRDAEYDLARRLQATVVARAPASERPADVVNLARACYRELRIPCGDRHVAASRAAAARDATLAASLSDVEALAGRARNVIRLQSARGMDDRLRLGHELVDLGRVADAIRVFQELEAQHPRDARPLVGQARASFNATMATGRVLELLGRARSLEHRDIHYYEMAIGSSFTRLMPIIQKLAQEPDASEAEVMRTLAEVIRPFREDMEGLERFEPARAAVIQVMLDGATALIAIPHGDDEARARALRAEASRLLGRAAALRVKFPREPAAHRLALMLTRFEAKATPEVEAILFAAIPEDVPDRSGLLETRAIAVATMVVSKGQLAWRERFVEMAEALAGGEGASWEGRNLRADAGALAAGAGKRGWTEVEADYRRLLGDAPDDAERARLHNNLGVALHHLGKLEEARTHWTESMRLGPELPVAEINHAAAGGGEPYGLGRLADLAENGGRSGVQFQAAAWRRHFDKARGESPKSIAEIREGIFKDEWSTVSDGRLGLILDESFQVSLGYSTTKGLILDFPILCKSWLVLPAPE